MIDSMRHLFAALAVLAFTGSALAQAQGAPASEATAAAAAPALKGGPPAGFVAPAEPVADETNAQRSKSQPGNNAPLWRAVRQSGQQQGFTSLPGAEEGTLIQPFVQYPGSRLTTAGEAWRQVRNQWILPYGGALLVITLLAIGLYYWTRGPLGGHHPNTGRMVKRFSVCERTVHFTVAASFTVLALSGLVMSFGKFFLPTLTGGTLFGVLTYGLKTVHNFVGPLFAVSLVLFIITYISDNLPRTVDLKWLSNVGGLFGGVEAHSHRFNAGEKIIFWGGVIVLGLVVVASGLVLDKLVPGMAYLRGDMQIAQMVHGVASVLMMAMFAGHIYLGTIGLKGAFDGMRTGYVDEAWAEGHHQLWFDDIKSGKVSPPQCLFEAAKPTQSLGRAAPHA
ncbi:MAG: formate dehydrogenase subunit gamma [Rubrivivax sp.]|nr:formate dehydrogenase subunit gamma [Rubrivivax sp.]